LIATLFLALTVNNALFARFNKKQNYYYADDDDVMILSPEEKEILDLERQGKEKKFMTE
jgi:DNA-binding NarL/FixJ family response regulator